MRFLPKPFTNMFQLYNRQSCLLRMKDKRNSFHNSLLNHRNLQSASVLRHFLEQLLIQVMVKRLTI